MVKNVLLYVAYFCLLVVLVVIIVLSFHSNKTGESKTNQPKTQTSQSQPDKSKQSSDSKSQSGSSAPSTSNSESPQASTNNLSNTGPGSVIAVFIGTVAVSSLGFSWYQRRNLANSLR